LNKFEKLFTEIGNYLDDRLTPGITSRIALYESRKNFFSIILIEIWTKRCISLWISRKLESIKWAVSYEINTYEFLQFTLRSIIINCIAMRENDAFKKAARSLYNHSTFFFNVVHLIVTVQMRAALAETDWFYF